MHWKWGYGYIFKYFKYFLMEEWLHLFLQAQKRNQLLED